MEYSEKQIQEIKKRTRDRLKTFLKNQPLMGEVYFEAIIDGIITDILFPLEKEKTED